MSINFAAANMAGYNNPEVYMLRVTVNFATGNVLETPSFTTISNILKSGFLPVLYVNFEDIGNSLIVPFTSINSNGDYEFSCALSTTVVTPSPVLFYIAYLKDTGKIVLQTVNL